MITMIASVTQQHVGIIIFALTYHTCRIVEIQDIIGRSSSSGSGSRSGSGREGGEGVCLPLSKWLLKRG